MNNPTSQVDSAQVTSTPVEPSQVDSPNPMPVVQNSAPLPTKSMGKSKQALPYDVFRNDPRLKSPFFAAFLSLVPGVGQIYVGYYMRGFINAIVVGMVISILTFSSNTTEIPIYFPLTILFLIFFWLYNIIDAWRRAVMYNLALQGVEKIPMPDDFKAPGLGGSLFGGIVLFAVSFMILLHTKFEMPLHVLEEWWPVVPMAFGGFLVYRHFEDKKAELP